MIPMWLARISRAYCALFFSLVGCAFINYAGIQTDEALFAGPLFRSWQFFSIPIGPYNLPLMNMSYNGTLKTWLYAPILLPAVRSTAALIRVPAILMGAATIVIFSDLLYRVHSRRAAWVGCILLATDTSFVLMTAHDWGPVALQHLLLTAAMFCAVRWFQTASSASLAVAAFCCGLAMWDKAVFIWAFAGILIGSLVFASGIRKRLTWRSVAIVTGALGFGGLPLIIYNFSTEPKFATIRANAQARSGEFSERLRILRVTANGSALFGYLAHEDWAPQPQPARSKLERVSFSIRQLGGEHRRNNMVPAYCGGLLLVPLLWRSRAAKAMWFCLIAMVVAWIFMVSTGGGDTHHAVLLWPLPQLFLAVTFAEAAQHVRFGKWLLGAVVGWLAVSNLLVTNQYLYQLIRDGGGDAWTDAIYPLAEGLRHTDASQIILPDWGMADSLCVLDRDKPMTHLAADPFLAELQAFSDEKTIWVEHVPGHESWPGVNDRVRDAAQRTGLEGRMLQIYYDRNGRAMFQTLRFCSKSPKTQ
jgi:hypothetical protein